MLKANILELKNEDVLMVAEIEKECFSKPWSEKAIKTAINDDLSHFIVAKIGNEVVGYGGMYSVMGEGYIYNIAVKRKYRKFGIGTNIVNELVNYSKIKSLNFLSLEVRKSNTPAINLYSNCGFEKVGNRKNFYTNPLEDAIIMTKFL
ncbi:MAG: ribosomal protein S18-alanine N-acetyltransferase [Clostridia bacterium]|nr:ribosomal protein S18-alanine N-acetyltransferase [Clostridia bacterium]